MTISWIEGVLDRFLEGLFGVHERERVLVVIDVGLRTFDGAQLLRADKTGIGVGFLVEALNTQRAPLGDTRFVAHVALWSPERFGDDHVEVPSEFLGPDRVRFPRFKFSQAPLDDYDALLLFGVRPGEPGDGPRDFKHDPADLTAIHEFMDGGKGLFAVGDHGELGADLCKEIKRVRSMRNWEARTKVLNDIDDLIEARPTDDVGDDVEVHRTHLGHYFDVPPIATRHRFDTNQPQMPAGAPFDANTLVPFGAQGDFRPQIVRTPAWGHHTILTEIESGGGSVLMPDHPHEGRTNHENIALYMSSWLVAERHLGDIADWDDYPGIAPGNFSGSGPKPELVLETMTSKFWRPWPNEPNLGEIRHSKGEVDLRRFGVLTIYDGLLSAEGVGRVAVDSTWHHWAAENVVGFPAHVYKRIANYWLNVVAWLCGPDALETTIMSLMKLDRRMPVQDLGLLVRSLGDRPDELDLELARRVGDVSSRDREVIYSDTLASVFVRIFRPDRFWEWYNDAKDVLTALRLTEWDDDEDLRVMQQSKAPLLLARDELEGRRAALQDVATAGHVAIGRVVAGQPDVLLRREPLHVLEDQLISPGYPAERFTVEIGDGAIAELAREYQDALDRVSASRS